MKAFREKNKFNNFMLWATLFSFVSQPLMVSAQTIADSSDGTATPVIDQTVNGTDLVHIARPHTDGVSHNLYLEFNVSSNGLILNNNATNAAVSTSQGEGVIPNFNFQGGNAASVILNEVTGGNLSSLLGDLEIAGAGAELIIANENGITCNGCGFINSTQTTLTTGKTIFDNSGNLTAFRVTDGMIDIGEEGLDASLSQSLNLLANGINVDGPVWANNLQAVAGQNNIDSETLSNTAIAGTASTTPLIDIGSLGGMYAKQIFLVTTGAGTGVNNSGKIGASVGDLIITSDGKLKSKGSMSAQSSMALNANEIDNQGSISSRMNMSLQANSVDNVGNVTSLANIALDISRLNNEGILSSKGTTDIEATGNVSNVGEINSAATMNISALRIDNTGAINVENGGLTLNSQQHINNMDTAKIVVASGNVAITDATQLNNDGIISLGAGNLTINSGQVNNTSDINLEVGDADIFSQDFISNTGVVNLESGNLSIASQEHVVNSGGINLTAGQLIVDSQKAISNTSTGVINLTTGDLSLDSQADINNAGGINLGAGDLTIKNSGNLNTSGDINLNVGDFVITSDGVVDNTGVINLDSGTLSITSQKNISNSGGINLTAGDMSLNSQNDISNTGGINLNSGNLVLISAGNTDTAGGINLSAGDLTINSGALVNNTSVINLEAGDLSIISQTDVDNTGTINLENGDAAISSQGLVSNAGDIHLEAGSLVISSQDHLDNAGRINLEAGDLSIASQQHIVNTGKINVKAGDAIITAQQYLNNTGEIISDAGAIDISATELINAGDISSQENQWITADVNNTGLITSKKKLTITTQGELNNHGTIASVEILDITSAIVHNAFNGRILAQSIFNITATDISNQSVISFFGGQWDAQIFSNEGTIENKINALVLTSTSLDNSGIINNINSDFTAISDTTLVNSGTIKSDGNMSLQATNDINNSGKIVSNGSVSISTQGNISNTPKNNTADATIEATGITLTGAEVINDSIIKSANDITVNATQRFNNNDQLTLVGDLIIDTNIFSNLGLANIYVGNDIWLNSNTFSNAADAAIVTEAGDLNIATASLNNNSFDNTGRIETIGGNLSILTHGNVEQNGELISTGDLTLYTGLTNLSLNNNDWSVTGNIKSNDTLTNNGIIHTEGVLKLGAYSIFNNKTITSTDDSSVVYAMQDITNNKDIYAKSGLDIIAGGNLNNSADATLISDNEFNIFVDSLFKNQGYLIGANTLSVAALEFKNIDAFISAGVLDIDVNKFSNDDKSGVFSSSDFKILAGSGGIKNDGEMFSKGKLSLTLDSVGTITNSASGSILSTGNMLLGTDSDCRDTKTCQANSDVTLNNYNDIQSDASMEINAFRFYNGIDKPALGDWLSNDDEAIEYQGDSGRYNTYAGAVKVGRTIGDNDGYHVLGHGYEAFIDWRKEKTETRSIADANLVQGLPKISAGNQVTLRTNDGKNHGGIIEAVNSIDVSRIDTARSATFINEAITTSETKTLFELGRNTYDCNWGDVACVFGIDDTSDSSNGNGWETESGTSVETAGGIMKAKAISFNDNGIKLENINEATDVKVAAHNTNVSTITDMQPSLSPVDFNGYSDLNLYTETVLNLASLPDQIQSVISALGIQIDGNINASITTNINTDIHTGNNTGFFPTGSNGLFVESTAPDREFLYVLNPRIPTDNSTQVGTDYLLQKMDVDIGNILRLGDASYEQQIIEQQIAMQASSRWITDAETAGEQLTILMDNGVEFADTNGLLVGESLTDEQILNLEKDLVWLEYSYLNGEIVLIPVVYLTQETKKHSAGAILAETIQLDVDTLGNDGGTIAATGDASIIAQGDIENIGGTIAADNLAIVSTEGSIINESVIRRVGTEDNYVDTATEALISANNDLILSANQNIEILGATVEAGNSAVVHTENGDVNVTSLVLESKTTTESHTQTGLFSSEHTKTVTTEQTQQTAGINVGGNLNENVEGTEQNSDQSQGGLLIYAANGAVNLTGADISSTDDIAIFADDVVTSTLALYSSTTTDTQSSGFAIGNGSIGVYSNDFHSESDATTASGTSISAGGNLLVDATNDIILEGGSISAQTGAFNAGNNFTTLAAADSNSTRENSSQSQAGIQVGDGGISGSASTTTSSASTNSTLYRNVDMQFEDGVSITARDTVDIGGLDLTVINVAEVVEPEPVPEANAENVELVENAEQPEPETSELAELDEATDSSIADMRSHLNTTALVAEIVSGTSDISTVAALTSQAIQDIQPEIALGSATITGDKVISTKFENTYNETSSTSTTSVGFSAGASDNGDGTSSVNASIGGGTSSASASTDILAENMNTISAGDLTISGKQSVDLVGVNLAGQDSVSLQSEGDINITAAKYVEEITSESSDTSFGISAGITVINGKQPTEEATDELIVNPFAPPASASIGVAFNLSNASSASTNNGHIDSSIISNGDVSIESGEGDISFKGVAVQANQTTIKGNSFTAAAYEDSFESSESSTQVGINLTASTDITESANSLFKGNGMQHSDSEASGTQEMGNTLVANELIIDVKNDVTIVGGDISAGKVDIKAHTVDLVAAKATLVETKNESGISLIAGGSAALGGEKAWANVDSMKDGAETGTSSSSGLADRTNDGRNNGGKAISDELVSGKIGLNITTRTEETTSTTYTNANIQFENLNIDTTDTTHSDDGHVDIGGANLVAFAGVDGESRTSSIDIKTGAVNTTKYVDTTDTNVTDTSTFVGVVVEGHSAIVDTYNHEITAQKKADEGMTADEGMRNTQHAADGMNMLMGDAAGGSASAAIKNSVTISNTSSTSENINYVNADNISITATEGNIDLKGVEFNAPPSYNEETGEMEASTGPRAQSISLNAKQDVNIEAAKSTFSETSTTVTTDLTVTASASVSATGSGMGVDAGYNGSMTTDSMDKTTYSNAQLNADNISITSENLALTGANVNGGNVDINVANDITVTSVQDTQTQTTDRANWGGSAGLNTMTVVSASVQGGGGSSHDNYQKTAQQSGINAESSLNVVAGNNLTLTGASLGVAEGGTGSVTAKTITANKLEDSHDKDGLFAGGGFGIDEGGVNANVDLETVDKIDQQITQNSTISGISINTENPIQGNNLTASGELQANATTEVKNERIAGVYLNTSVSTAGTKKLAQSGSAGVKTAKTKAVGATSAMANKILPKKIVVISPPIKKAASNLKDGHTKASTESVIVVIPASKDGKTPDTVVQTAADAVANKQANKDRNVVVVKENQDGSLQVVKGDMETVTGNTKIDVVSHGNDLKDSGAESVATLIKKVADESGLTDSNKNSELTKVNLTACGDCNKTSGKTIGEQVTTQLASNGITPKLKEHNSKIQVTDSGNVIAFNDKNATTLTHQIEDGKVTTAIKTEKNLSDTQLKNTLGDDGAEVAPKTATENLSDKTKGMRPAEEVKALANATSLKADIKKYTPEANYSKLETDRMSGSRSLEMPTGIRARFMDADQKQLIVAKQTQWRDTDAIARQGASDIGLKATSEQLNTLIIALNTKATEGTPKAGMVRNEDRGGGLLPPEHISTELSNFTNWLSGALAKVDDGVADPVIVAAKAGQRLNTIHPFGDGNGRVINLTIDFILLSSGLPPSSAGHPPKHVDTKQAGTPEQNQAALDAAVAIVRNGVEKSIAILEKEAADAAAAITKLAEDGNGNNKGLDGKEVDGKSDDSKDGHTKTSTESVVVVIPASKDSKAQDAVVQDAAIAVAKKQTNKDRNVVVVKENQDGSLQVVKGDMETVTGNTKIDVVSHGSTLKDNGAESVATLIKKVADESGLTDSNTKSELSKVNLTACGDCNKTDGKTIGEQVTTQLVDKGLTPSVKEHDSKVQVQKDGTVVAFNNESNAAKTLTHQVKEGVIVTATQTKNIKHLTDQPLQNALVKGDDDSATNGQWVDGQPVGVNGLPFTMNMSHENDQQAQTRIDNLNTWLPTERKIIQQTQAGLQNPDSNVFKQSSHMVHDQRGEIARHINEAPIKPLTQSEVLSKVSSHKETLDDAGTIQLLNEIKNTGEAIFVKNLIAENSTLPKFEVDTSSNLSPEVQHKQYQDKVLTDHIKTLDEKNQMKTVEEISLIGERLIAEQLVQDQKRQENVEWVTTKRPQDGSTAYKETMALMASGAEGPLTIAQSAQGAQAAAAGYQILSKDDGAVTAGIKNKEIVQEQVPASYAERKVVNDIVAPIKAVRDVDPDPVAQNKAQERAEKTGTAYRAPVSHPTASKHGVILANDPGTQSRDAHGLPIMTGTSGTTASVTRSVIRSRATNNAVDKKTPVNAETLQKLSIAAEGLSDMQAANAVKDLALTWMRDGAFSQALKTGIDGRLKKTDDAYQSVNEDLNRVQTHSYPEVAEGFDRTMNLKNKDQREIADQIDASSKESLARLKANKVKYDSAVVVMTRDKDGEISTAVKDSADDIKQQYPDTVVLTQNKDGSVDVGGNGEKLKNIKGDTRIDVIGHGSDLKDKGADQVATLIDKVASEIDRNENETKVTRAEIVACGDCAKDGEKTFGQQVVEKMTTKDVAVAEHDTAIQVNKDGSRSALKAEGSQPQKIVTTKTDKGVTTRTRDKKDSETVAVLDSTRQLTLHAKESGVPRGFEGVPLVATVVKAGADTDTQYHVVTQGTLEAANDKAYRENTGLDDVVGRIRNGKFEKKKAKAEKGDAVVHISRRGSVRLAKESANGSVSYTRISSGATSDAIRAAKAGTDFATAATASLLESEGNLPNAAKMTTTEVAADGTTPFNTTVATAISGDGIQSTGDDHQATMALLTQANTEGRRRKKEAVVQEKERLLKEYKTLIKSKQKEIDSTKAGSKRDKLVAAQKKRALKLPAKKKALKDEQDLLNSLEHSPMQDSHSEPLATALTNQARAVNGMSQLDNADTVSLVTSVNRAVCAWCGDGFEETTSGKDGSLIVGEAWVPFQHSRTGFDEENNSFLYRIVPHQQRVDSDEALQAEVEQMGLIYRYAAGQADRLSRESSNDDFSVVKNAVDREESSDDESAGNPKRKSMRFSKAGE
jgi:filamentous hemagglutinin